MTASDEDAIALLRIELEDIEPLIWRRVAVPTSMSLKAVHNVIQAAMGWLDNHLWEFKINDGKYGILIPNDPDWNERINNAATTKLSALLATGITEIGYIYDFGDNWQHRIIVEKLKPAEPGALYPQFLGGERRCPPEDCGGFPGYYDFLDKIASKQSKKRCGRRGSCRSCAAGLAGRRRLAGGKSGSEMHDLIDVESANVRPRAIAVNHRGGTSAPGCTTIHRE
jgi:hypothetical protein